jgi:5-methylthioadenosine/S-adenosylhomocysteine deaminase
VEPTRCDLLIQNAHVVTFDDAGTSIPDGAVAVVDGRIADVGPTSALEGRWIPDRRVFASGKIAMPGLTDAHFHTAQTLMRGLLAQLRTRGALRVPTWREYLVPFESALTPDDVELSGQLAYSTMLRTGTTSFFESGGPHPERMAEAALATGIRGSVALSTMDGGNRIPQNMLMTTEEALARNVALVEAYPSAADGSSRVTACMALRQIIVCTPELVRDLHDEARARGVKVHTHLVEGTYEIDYALEHYGHRPVDYLAELGVFTDTLHGAHSILVDDHDIDRFAAAGVSAAHCAKGNYSIGVPPALRMWRRNVSIGLGTDGVGVLGTLDLFRVAMLTHVGQQFVEATPVHNRNGVELAEPLAMATRGGSRAMGLDAHTGSLEVGKQADVLLLRTDGPDAVGFASAEAFLYEAASGRDVDTVFVAGEQVVADGVVTTIDAVDVAVRAARRQAELATAIA